MKAALVPLRNTLQLNTRLLFSALDGVDETVAVTRPNASTNHITFISCHLIESRHYLAGCAGCKTESPFMQLASARRLEDVTRFPTLAEIRVAWSDIARILDDRLPQLSEADLQGEMKSSFPIEGGKSLLGCITFLLGHEAFHIGQVALLRRYFGLGAMKY
jgi:hypothetical protein